MSYQQIVASQAEAEIYRFGRSRQLFRGPEPCLDDPYIACIGGAETFGKQVPVAFPAFLGDELCMACANWGAPGAGPDLFLGDPVLLEACSNASTCVVTVMSAHTMSNRLYSVFLRRNERFREVNDLLMTLYPGVRFEDFRFVSELLATLEEVDAARFAVIKKEIRAAWVARMQELLGTIQTRTVLLWFSDLSPDEAEDLPADMACRGMPSFVTREMVEAVRPLADIYIEYVAPADVAAEGPVPLRPAKGGRSVRRSPSAGMHRAVALRLAEELSAST